MDRFIGALGRSRMKEALISTRFRNTVFELASDEYYLMKLRQREALPDKTLGSGVYGVRQKI